MQKLTKSILFLALSLLLISCAAPKPKIVAQPAKPLPSWYLTPPAGSSVYLYGIGSGRDIQEATKEALDNMLAQLSVSIESSLEVTTKASTSSYSQDTKRNIKSEVAKVKINNYQVEKSEQIKYNQFVVLVKSDREEFARGLTSDLDSFFADYDARKNTFAKSSIVSRYNFHKDSSDQAEAHKATVAIAKGVDSSVDEKPKLAKIQAIQNDFERTKQSLSFAVLASGNANKMAEPIKAALAKEKFAVGANGALLEVSVKVSVDYINASGMRIANVVTVFETKEKGGAGVGSSRHQFKTNGANGESVAVENTASQLALKIKEDGIFSVLGLKID